MTKFIIPYLSTDDFTYFVDSYRVVEADSKEKIQLIFLEKLEKAVKDNIYCFHWLDIEFKVSEYVYVDHWTKQTVWKELEVMTVDEFLNSNCYKI